MLKSRSKKVLWIRTLTPPSGQTHLTLISLKGPTSRHHHVDFRRTQTVSHTWFTGEAPCSTVASMPEHRRCPLNAGLAWCGDSGWHFLHRHPWSPWPTSGALWHCCSTNRFPRPFPAASVQPGSALGTDTAPASTAPKSSWLALSSTISAGRGFYIREPPSMSPNTLSKCVFSLSVCSLQQCQM